MPDITVTHSLVNELLLSHVEERHIHVIAKEGVPMEASSRGYIAAEK